MVGYNGTRSVRMLTWFSVISVVCLANIVRAAAVYMDELAAVVNLPLDVRCTMTLEPEDLPNEFRLPFVFDQESSNVLCQVSDWQYCNATKRPPHINADCWCLTRHKYFRMDVSKIWAYRFNFRIPKVTKEDHKRALSCFLGGGQDKKEIYVVEFNHIPQRQIFNCSGGSMIFSWDFVPEKDIIQRAFLVKKIEWHFTPTKSKEVKQLAVYRYLKSNGEKVSKSFSNYEDDRLSTVDGGGDLRQLYISRLEKEDEGTIKIKVTFLEEGLKQLNNINWRDRARRALFGGSTTSTTTDLQDAESTTGHSPQDTNEDWLSNDIGTISLGLSESSTITTTTATDSTTTTSMPAISTIRTTTKKTSTTEVYEEPITVGSFLEDSVELVVTQPPSEKLVVTIEGKTSVTGTIIVSCSLSKASFMGNPTVNLTIWRSSRVLTTRTGVTNLRYSEAIGQSQNYSCGLTGKALECLNSRDKRLQRSVLRKTEKLQQPKSNIDQFLVLFGIETALCALLMFWNISLMLDHITLIIRRKQKRIETLRKIQEQKILKRQFDMAEKTKLRKQRFRAYSGSSGRRESISTKANSFDAQGAEEFEPDEVAGRDVLS